MFGASGRVVNMLKPSPEKKIIQFKWAGGQANDRHLQDLAFDTSQLGLGQVGEWSMYNILHLKNIIAIPMGGWAGLRQTHPRYRLQCKSVMLGASGRVVNLPFCSVGLGPRRSVERIGRLFIELKTDISEHSGMMARLTKMKRPLLGEFQSHRISLTPSRYLIVVELKCCQIGKH